MAELTAKERLLPSLIDRLTDDDPGKAQESRDSRTMNLFKLRNSILRDLESLMNTTNLESVIDFELYPDLRSTVINYGMPGLSGVSADDFKTGQIQQMITDVILAFEPRILKNTLKVTALPDSNKDNPRAVAFQIEGTMWGRPMPEALFLRTELDLELGNVKVSEGEA